MECPVFCVSDDGNSVGPLGARIEFRFHPAKTPIGPSSDGSSGIGSLEFHLVSVVVSEDDIVFELKGFSTSCVNRATRSKVAMKMVELSDCLRAVVVDKLTR